MHRQRGNFSIGHFKDKSSGGKSSAWWQTHLTLAKPTGGSAREAEVTEHENTHKLSHLKVILHMIRYHFSYNAYMHLSNGIVLRGSFMSICLASSLGLGGGRKKQILSLTFTGLFFHSSCQFAPSLPHILGIKGDKEYILLARMDAEDFACTIGQAAEHFFSSPSTITDSSDSAGWISVFLWENIVV